MAPEALATRCIPGVHIGGPETPCKMFMACLMMAWYYYSGSTARIAETTRSVYQHLIEDVIRRYVQ